MRFFRGAKSGERCDPAGADRRHRRDARADRLTVKMHGAGAALRQSAAEMRIIQIEIVAQHIEERRVRVGGDGMDGSVDAQRKFLTHSGESSGAAVLLHRIGAKLPLSCWCRLVAKQVDWEQGLAS